MGWRISEKEKQGQPLGKFTRRSQRLSLSLSGDSVQRCQFSHSASHRYVPTRQIFYGIHVCASEMLVVLKGQRSACWNTQSREISLSMLCVILHSVIHLSTSSLRFGGWFTTNLNFAPCMVCNRHTTTPIDPIIGIRNGETIWNRDLMRERERERNTLPEERMKSLACDMSVYAVQRTISFCAPGCLRATSRSRASGGINHLFGFRIYYWCIIKQRKMWQAVPVKKYTKMQMNDL